MNDSNYNLVNVRSSAILTTSYVASTVLGPTVVNPQYNKRVSFFVEITIGSLTSVEVKVEGSPDGTAYSKLHGPTEYSFTASGTYIVTVPAFAPYVKASVKGTGTVTNSLVKITAICSDTPSSLDEYDTIGNLKSTLATKLDKTNDSITAHIAASDSRIAITASAQVLSGPGKLKGFWIISHTAGATVRFSDALTDTTPYVGSAWTSAAGHLAGTYIMISQNGLQMATGCYCTITGTIEILPDAKLD